MNHNKKFVLILSVLLPVALISSGCGSSDKNESGNTKRITVSGAFALYPLVTKWGEEFSRIHPDIKLDIQAGGAGKGMTDVLAGATDIGMFSRTISQAEKERGVWWVAVTKDAVIPTVSRKNPFLKQIHQEGITKQDLKTIYLESGKVQWSDILDGVTDQSKSITVFTRSDASGAAETFAAYLGAHQEDLNGVGVLGDPGVADAVRKDPLSMGYNNTIYIYDVETGRKNEGIDVIPLDQNANGTIEPSEDFYDSFDSVLKAINSGAYPSPPARELYLITKGKPQKESVITFIEWVLSKGQKYVRPSGYVPLTEEYIAEQKEKLK